MENVKLNIIYSYRWLDGVDGVLCTHQHICSQSLYGFMVELEDSFESLSIRLAKSKVDSQSIVSVLYGVWFPFPLLAENMHMKAIFIDGETARFRSRSTVRNKVMLAFNFALSVYLFTHRKKATWAEKVDCFHSIASISNWLPSSSFDSSIMFHAPSAHSTVCERDSGRLYNFLLYIGPQYVRVWVRMRVFSEGMVSALRFNVWQNGVFFTLR